MSDWRDEDVDEVVDDDEEAPSDEAEAVDEVVPQVVPAQSGDEEPATFNGNAQRYG